MAIKPEKKSKYYRKYSNNFAADCNSSPTLTATQKCLTALYRNFSKALKR